MSTGPSPRATDSLTGPLTGPLTSPLTSTVVRTAYADVSRDLVAELAGAGLDPLAVYEHVVLAFEEDLPDGGVDVTSAAMPPMGRAVADVVAREDGVVAGLAVAELAFRYALDEQVRVTDRVPDGSRVRPGDVVLTVEGPVQGVLTAERTALNFASHLSGVATATAAWVQALEGTAARVLDTRKTLPGWRALQ
jgi:nicotinate-nucleotide pyrophosphorylase (carboxylating)